MDHRHLTNHHPNEATGGASNVEAMHSILQDMRLASTDTLLKTAAAVVADKVARSCELDLAAEDRIPKFDIRELTVGRVVGRGGFCVVQDVKGLEANSTMMRRWGGGDSAVSGFLSRMVTSKKVARQNRSHRCTTDRISAHQAGKASSSTVSESCASGSEVSVVDRKQTDPSERRKYVLKRMSLEHPDKITFLQGTADLAMETRFLASLDHANIIGLHGVSRDGPFVQGYFLILEKMKEMLPKRIKKWMDRDRQCKGITGVFTGGSKKKLRTLQSERIATALDIARGSDYLHQRKIIFRDLKPDNIGFNAVGILKIFDFGLAKELEESERTKDGLYKMTGLTGAFRYMAPEVGLSRPYNLSADVYSWAMIFWYILALEPPFCLYSHEGINDRVFLRDFRPKIFTCWSPRIVNVMNQAWSKNLRERPTFKEISVVLKSELTEIDPKHAYLIDSQEYLTVIAE